MSRAHARLAAAAAAVVFGLVGCSSAAVDTPADPPAASAPATPALDEESACVALVPVLQDGATAILAIAQQPDGSTVDQVQLGETIRALQALELKVPASMRQNVHDQIGSLVTLQHILSTAQNQQLDLQTFRASGLTLGTTCRQYAH